MDIKHEIIEPNMIQYKDKIIIDTCSQKNVIFNLYC